MLDAKFCKKEVLLESFEEIKMNVRVLIIGMYETVGGIETFLLNYLKHMDTSKIDLYYAWFYDNKCRCRIL